MRFCVRSVPRPICFTSVSSVSPMPLKIPPTRPELLITPRLSPARVPKVMPLAPKSRLPFSSAALLLTMTLPRLLLPLISPARPPKVKASEPLTLPVMQVSSCIFSKFELEMLPESAPFFIPSVSGIFRVAFKKRLFKVASSTVPNNPWKA